MLRAHVLVGGFVSLVGAAMGQVLSPIDVQDGTRVPSIRPIAAVGLSDRALLVMQEPLGVALTPTSFTTPVLHISDGTTTGTSLIDTSLRMQFPSFDYNSEMQWFVTPEGRVFFVSGGATVVPPVIWTTDGTSLGTRLVGTMSRVFNSATRASQSEAWRSTLMWSDSGLFWQDPATRALRLARNTPAGLLAPVDVQPTLTLSTSAIGALDQRVVVGTGNGVWVTDGTSAGTFRLTTQAQARDFTSFAGRVYYTDVTALWSTDGTSAGTRLELQFPPPRIGPLFPAGDRLYLGVGTALASIRAGETPTFVPGLFFSFSVNDPLPPVVAFGDGVLVGGTSQTLSLARGSALTALIPPGRVLDVEQRLPWAVVGGSGNALRAYFLTSAGGMPRVLYRTDGTVAGTVPVDLGSAVLWSRPRPLAWAAGHLFFRDQIGERYRVFALNEATGIVTEIADPSPVGAPSTSVSTMIDQTVPIFGPASDGRYRRTAGTSDRTGTFDTTFDPAAMVTPGGVFSFIEAAGGGTDVLWAAARGGERTLLGRVGGPPNTAANSSRFVNGRLLLFSAQTIGGTDTTLWAASPQEGVSVVWPLNEGGIGAVLGPVLIEGDRMTFVAPLGGVQRMIRTDGTRANTLAISDDLSLLPRPWPISSLAPGLLTGGAAIISASDGAVNQLPLARGAPAVRTTDVALLGTSAIFAAAPTSPLQQIDIEPAITDGTAAGTRILRDIVPGSAGSLASQFTLASTAEGPRVFFFARDPALGRELWITDGTPEGTRMVVDLAPGFNSGIREETPYPPTSAANAPPITPIVAVDGGVVFVGDDGVRGLELWKSDGTAAGTVPLPEIVPGPLSGNITSLINVGGTLYFYATGRAEGRELWSLTLGERDLCSYDFNGDENVDLLDAQQMAAVFVGILSREAGWFGGDLSGDENADLTDAQALAQYVVSGVCPF